MPLSLNQIGQIALAVGDVDRADAPQLIRRNRLN